MKPFKSDIDRLQDSWDLQNAFLNTPDIKEIKKAFEEMDKHPFRFTYSQIHHIDGMTYFTDDNLNVRASMPTEDYEALKRQ